MNLARFYYCSQGGNEFPFEELIFIEKKSSWDIDCDALKVDDFYNF